MKISRVVKFTVTMLSVILLLTVCTAYAFAADDGAYTHNSAVYRTEKAILEGEQAKYTDKNPSGSVASRVNAVILQYEAELGVLSTSPRAQEIYLDGEFAAIREKGILLGELAWITYAHTERALPENTDGSTDAILQRFNRYKSEIDAKTDADEISAVSSLYRTAMLKAVFADNLTLLLRPGQDSEAVEKIITKASADIGQLSSSDIDAAEYLAVYGQAKNDVKVQRARDSAKKELDGAVKILFPSGLAPDNTVISDFDGALSSAASVSDVNGILRDAVTALIELRITGSDKYISELRDALLVECASAVLSANAAEEVAVLSDVLNGIELKEKRALAKDSVFALSVGYESDLALANLISEYNSKGGILDECSEILDIELEKERAVLRAQLYFTYTQYRDKIVQTLIPTGDTQTAALRAESIYKSTDRDISLLDRTAQNVIERCQGYYAEGVAALNELSFEADAQLYSFRHKDILEKNAVDVTESDRTALEAAISAFDLLAPETADRLSAEKEDLNLKYKNISKQMVLSLIDGAVAERICGQVDELSALLSPSAHKQALDGCVRKAETVKEMRSKYSELISADNYDSYDEKSKSDMLEALENGEVSALESDGLADTLNRIELNAELSMERYACIAQVKLASDGSTLSAVANTLQMAVDGINSANDISSMREIRDEAVFRIGCHKRAEQMRGEVDSLKTLIDGLRALGSVEKAEFKAEADSLLAYCDSADGATESSLSGIVAEFEAKLSEIKESAESESLKEGIKQANEYVADEIAEAKRILDGYEFIDGETKKTYSGLFDGLLTDFKAITELDGVSWSILDGELNKTLIAVEKAQADAEADEKSACRLKSAEDIRAVCPDLSFYSDENRERINEIFSESDGELQNADSISELLAVRDRAVERLNAISTLLDEAKDRAAELLAEAYAEIKQYQGCYSAERWAELDGIYRQSAEEIKLLADISDAQRAESMASERIALMKNVKMDSVYTDDKMYSSGAQGYPDGYDVIRNGYSGKLSSEGKIPYGASFSVFPFSSPDKTAQIRKAVKDKNVLFGGSLAGKELLRSLKGCSVLTGLDIQYSAAVNGVYVINILLPAALDVSDILGIVYISDSGTLEFYECEIRGNSLSFEIPHFSSFYIVTERSVNLLPLIIAFVLILLAEAAVLALLITRRIRAKREASLSAFMPFFAITALTKYTPAGAVTIAAVLGFLIMGAAGAIAYLLLAENKKPSASSARGEEKILLEEPEAEVASAPLPVAVPAVREERARFEAVCADEVDSLMTDDEANEALRVISETELPKAIYTAGGRKYEINIDIISRNFASDETVSIESLKQKKLISKNARAVKILARGTLDKPLTVIAQDFSTAAVKMITLTGGHAVIVDKNG